MAPQRTVRVKICGLTCAADARACVDAGVDWIGLNFHPASPRYINEDRAAEIIAALPDPRAAVGVFVDRPPADVRATCERLGLTAVQLHGREPVTDLAALGHLLVIKAFRLGGPSGWPDLIAYLEQARAGGRGPDAVLIDSYSTRVHGGTGVPLADDILDFTPTIPRLILAGGLTPENVAERIARARPWMVDAASGVEIEPGRKDLARVVAFIEAARTAPHECAGAGGWSGARGTLGPGDNPTVRPIAAV